MAISGNGFFPAVSASNTLRQLETSQTRATNVGGPRGHSMAATKPSGTSRTSGGAVAAIFAAGLWQVGRKHKRKHLRAKVKMHAYYEVTPREGCAFGASVRGFSVKEALDSPEAMEQIRSDMYKHRLLIFHGQTDLMPEDHIKLSEKLGSMDHILHRPHPKSPDPRLLRVANDDREGFMSVGTSGWHVDGVMLQAPFAAQTMHHLHAIPGEVG